MDGEEGRSEGESGGDKILSDKVKEKDQLVAQITGLDFGRFTKSMLLAQGGFAAFLNAEAGKRADLLEQIPIPKVLHKWRVVNRPSHRAMTSIMRYRVNRSQRMGHFSAMKQIPFIIKVNMYRN